MRQPQGSVALRIAEVGEDNVLTSILVACELRYGAAKRASRKLTRQVETVLGALTILPFEPDTRRLSAEAASGEGGRHTASVTGALTRRN